MNATAQPLPTARRPFDPSPLQANYFRWIETGRGSCVLIAVAGSGKSTTIVQGLRYIPEMKGDYPTSVQMLVFSQALAPELKEKIAALGIETGRAFRGVRVNTFHSLGNGALRKFLNNPADYEIDARKCYKLFEAAYAEHPELIDMYAAFVAKLVSFGKGIGIGCLVPDETAAWQSLIDHHDLSLDSEEADEPKAIKMASWLLRKSNEVAKTRHLVDFDDQIYLPVLWRLRLWRNDWVFVDEAQDTSPIRRALAKMALVPGGRLVAVGDPNQSIFGFTGASHDAIDRIKAEFNAVEMPLTVSYRCPKVAEQLVAHLVPHFRVHEANAQGRVSRMTEKAGIARLGNTDAVLCRNTAPLIDTAFSLIAQGRGCTVLGKDIGAGLVNLIKKQKAKGIDGLTKKLEAYRDREIAKFMAKGEEQKAESISDRVASIMAVIDRMNESERTVPALIAKLESMFSDDGKGLLTLCTAHKAKGREWKRIAILAPELMPSKWARQEHQVQQENNLIYVAHTRFQEELIFLDGTEEEVAHD